MEISSFFVGVVMVIYELSFTRILDASFGETMVSFLSFSITLFS